MCVLDVWLLILVMVRVLLLLHAAPAVLQAYATAAPKLWRQVAAKILRRVVVMIPPHAVRRRRSSSSSSARVLDFRANVCHQMRV